jgi:hypothetical protein
MARRRNPGEEELTYYPAASIEGVVVNEETGQVSVIPLQENSRRRAKRNPKRKARKAAKSVRPRRKAKKNSKRKIKRKPRPRFKNGRFQKNPRSIPFEISVPSHQGIGARGWRFQDTGKAAGKRRALAEYNEDRRRAGLKSLKRLPPGTKIQTYY